MAVIRYGAYFLVGLAVLLGIGLFILSRFGGATDGLRTFIERTLSEKTGYEARVETLNSVQFFPLIAIDMDGLSFVRPGTQDQVARVAHVDAQMGFWSAIFAKGDLQALNVRDVVIDRNIVLAEPVALSHVGIVPDAGASDGRADFSLKGTVGAYPVVARVGLDNVGTPERPTYALSRDTAIVAQLMGFDVRSDVMVPNKGQVLLSGFTVARGKTVHLLADLALAMKSGEAQLDGDVSFGRRSRMLPDVAVKSDGAVKGSLVFSKLDIEDAGAVAGVIFELGDLFRGPEAAASHTGKTAQKSDRHSGGDIGFDGLDVAVDVDIHDLMNAGKSLGRQAVNVRIADGALRVDAPKGLLAEGRTDVMVRVTPSGTSGLHDVVVSARGDEVRLQRVLQAFQQDVDVEVRFDMAAEMTASVRSWEALPGGLAGDVTLVSEAGRLDSSWLNLWGNGLGSLILPKFNARDEAALNCAIIDMKARAGVFAVQSWFIDGESVRITGSGDYDLPNDMLALHLSPQTKGVSIGDLSSSVRVTGPLAEPSVRPDALDAGKKGATFLLGIVSPALMAVATTDLGVLDQTLDEDVCAPLGTLKRSNTAEGFWTIRPAAPKKKGSFFQRFTPIDRAVAAVNE